MRAAFTRIFQALVLPILLSVSINLPGQYPDSLMTGDYNFEVTSHVVGTAMFHWYTAYGGQVSGPWIPLEGRENWTGDADFWKRMIKQSMAANIDVYYVHLIPQIEQPRIHLFQALYELRVEGWDVPKVCPFFDPLITYTIQGSNVDVSTEAGKDELVGHYIRFFEQYYSQNPDEYADDYIYTIDGKVVLDTWHVHINIINYTQITRYDFESRLSTSLGPEHPVFYNGIRMITNAISPSYAFADEKVHQFEVHEYYIENEHNSIVSAQIKPGYWDQNVRNPGYIMPRDGGSKYKTAWNQVNASLPVNRIYIESFNEYDEGSGIYAAKTDEIYYNDINTSTDTWSASDDPYEYIKTTALGAAGFNDDDELNAKILWHNIPDAIIPGDTFIATVVVRNTGNAQWNDANGFKFGENESLDPVVFGPTRYLIDDTKDEIPVYGGIFRGRTKTFNIEIIGPDTIGSFVTHWGMLKENVAWFGETVTKTITSSLSADVKQAMVHKEFKVYPNPVSPGGTIQIDGEFRKNDRAVLININGNKIHEQIIHADLKHLSLPLKPYQIVEGLYFIQLISNNNIQTGKILVGN